MTERCHQRVRDKPGLPGQTKVVLNTTEELKKTNKNKYTKGRNRSFSETTQVEDG